jgi:hypothetical protein
MSSREFSSFLAYTPCGAHGTAKRSLMPWLASFFSTAGFCASQSFLAWSNEVARKGTTSRP